MMTICRQILLFIVVTLLFNVTIAFGYNGKTQVWTTSNGVEVLGDYLGFNNAGVSIRTKEGKDEIIPFSNLTDDNKQWIYANYFHGSSRRALLIGVSNTEIRDSDGAKVKNIKTPNAVNDLKTVESTLKNKLGFLDSDIVILSSDSPLEDKKPTLQNIAIELKKIQKTENPFSLLFVYFSGVGCYLGENIENVDDRIMSSDGMPCSVEKLSAEIENSCTFKWIVIDADCVSYDSLCNAGGLTERLQGVRSLASPTPLDWTFEIKDPGFLVVRSCSRDQTRNEDNSCRLGLFTSFLTRRIDEQCKDADSGLAKLDSIVDLAIKDTKNCCSKDGSSYGYQKPVVLSSNADIVLPKIVDGPEDRNSFSVEDVLPPDKNPSRIVRNQDGNLLTVPTVVQMDVDYMTQTVNGVEYAFRRIPDCGCWMLDSEVSVKMWRSFVNATGYSCGKGNLGEGGFGYIEGVSSPGFYEELTWDNPGSNFSGNLDSYPVVQIDYRSAVEFCQWLGGQLGMTCSLPTSQIWDQAFLQAEHSNSGEVPRKYCDYIRSHKPDKLNLYN